MKIKAYAKLNLILNVIGKRDDGFHELETLMQAISLHDDIDVSTSKGGGIWIDSEGIPMNLSPSNLAYKAADLMLQSFDKNDHVNIKINKRIPIAAGLGGGSADAAAVINALAGLWNIDDEEALMQLGSKLGSDVPFCMAAQRGKYCAIARGRGEKLEYVKGPELGLKLVRLDIHIKNKTAKVYQALEPEDYREKFSVEKLLAAKGSEEQNALIGNHLEAAAKRVIAAEGCSCKELEMLYPNGPYHLCGAGPTLFYLSEDTDAIRTIK